MDPNLIARASIEIEASKEATWIPRCEPGRALQYTHFSPLSGLPDRAENHHTVTIELTGDGERTRVELAQDNNPTQEAPIHSQKNWEMMLGALKQFLER